jgi:hypothetical protein
VPRPSLYEAARLHRDAALSRFRKLTIFAGLGALGLTAAASLIAATTIPGRNLAAQPPAASNPGPSAPDDQSQQGFVPPNQLPQPASGDAPSAVSGGS